MILKIFTKQTRLLRLEKLVDDKIIKINELIARKVEKRKSYDIVLRCRLSRHERRAGRIG